MKKLQLLAIVLFATGNLLAQDTILHRNGSVFIVDLVERDNGKIYYKKWNQDDSRTFSLDEQSVFSIREKNSNTDIVYEYNPKMGNIYQVDEMRLFIKGQQDALHHQSTATKVISIIGGAAGGYVLGRGGILGITTPVVLPAILSVPRPRVRERNVRDMRYHSIEAYRAGYVREAKKNRYFDSLILSSISMGVATIVSALVFE